MRVIASVYTGSTEKRALDELVGLGAQGQGLVRDLADAAPRQGLALRAEHPASTPPMSAPRTSRTRRSSTGSSGMSELTEIDNPHIIERIRATFEQYWNEPEFEPYDPRVDGDRLAGRARRARGSPALDRAPYRLAA